MAAKNRLKKFKCDVTYIGNDACNREGTADADVNVVGADKNGLGFDDSQFNRLGPHSSSGRYLFNQRVNCIFQVKFIGNIALEFNT